MKTLILRHDWTPEVQNLIHWVLLESGKADSFFEDEWMVLQELLTIMRGGKKLWNFRSSPNNECLFRRIVILVHFLVLSLIHLILSNLEVCKFTESLFESLSFQTVSRDNNEVDIVLSENILELFFISRVLSHFFLEAWSLFLALSWLARRNKVEEVLVCNKLSVLINNSNCCLEIPVVKRIHDGTEDVESFSLRNDVLLDSTIGLHNLLHFIIDLEISSAHHF